MHGAFAYVTRVSCIATFAAFALSVGQFSCSDGAGQEAESNVPFATVVDSLVSNVDNKGPRAETAALTEGQPYRIVAANLSSGPGQSYDPGHGTRLLRALSPDLALVQEMNCGDNQPAAVRTWVDAAFGDGFSYVQESGKNIPNGVVSRFPIVESGVWRDSVINDRSFVWARINTPDGKRIFAVSVHLSTRSGLRGAEGPALRRNLDAQIRAGELVVVGGDFNADSANDIGIRALEPTVGTGGKVPADESGNRNTNASRNKPYDQVLLSPALARAQVPSLIGGSSFPNGFVFDTRRFSNLGSLPPARPGDSAAPQMQHMAVVRDVALSQAN